MRLLGPRNLLLVLALAFVVLSFRDDPGAAWRRAQTVVDGTGAVLDWTADATAGLVRSLLD